MRTWRSEKGAALLEAAVTIPILLLISAGIFEFGRAYQTWQVLTNAAREGARVSVLPNLTVPAVEQRVRDYMQAGQLPLFGSASVAVNRGASITVNGTAVSASEVTVDYPFSFMVLRPIARLLPGASSTSLGAPVTMRAQALMRNE
jgi:Flp pilus assembly protein TadG